jgi:hypothetical protein
VKLPSHPKYKNLLRNFKNTKIVKENIIFNSRKQFFLKNFKKMLQKNPSLRFFEVYENFE